MEKCEVLFYFNAVAHASGEKKQNKRLIIRVRLGTKASRYTEQVECRKDAGFAGRISPAWD